MEAQTTQLKGQPRGTRLSIDRITIERLDPSSDMARTETVPMLPDHLAEFGHMGPRGQGEYLVAPDRLNL